MRPLAGSLFLASFLIGPGLLDAPEAPPAREPSWCRVRPDELARYGLTLTDVLDAARQATGVRGGGFLENDRQRLVLRIEGQVYDWNEETITVPQIRTLGGLPTDLPVIQIDLETNTQIQLAEDAVVELKPGLGFSKKVKWQRG